MKTLLSSTALILLMSGFSFAAGSHDDGHSHGDADHKNVQDAAENGHTDGHDHSNGHGDHHENMAVGMPGSLESVTRTVDISMVETEDGEMLFSPASLDVEAGETVRFLIANTGELEHEFVLDTIERNAKHKAQMQQFPEMEHDDPNSIRLDAGQSGEIIWSFSNSGDFEFACLIPGHYESGMFGGVKVAEAALEYTNGVVKKVNPKSGKVTIIHEELKALGMPAMTMVFRVADDEMLEELEAGDDIEFVAERLNGKLTVTNLK